MQKRRRILKWPPEAVAIATGKGDPIHKCAELMRVSKYEKEDCWRFLKKYGIERPPHLRRNRSQWPKEAITLVEQRSMSPIALHRKLMRISGNGEKECWRFLEKHGIYRPGSATRINWFKYRFEEVQEYAAGHGIKAAAQKYKIPVKSISNAFYRRERTGLARDALSLRDVCIYLQYRPKEVLEWVAEGRLEAEKQIGKNGYIVYHFQLDTLKRFCEQNPSLLKRRRWPKQRFEFLEKIVFAPKHAELIDECETKRGHRAFTEQEE